MTQGRERTCLSEPHAASITCAIALGTALLAGAALAQQKTIAIATGGTGGVYYPLGGGLANVISKNLPGVQATAEVTGGSVDNLKLIGTGQSELALLDGGRRARCASMASTSSRATRSRCAP